MQDDVQITLMPDDEGNVITRILNAWARLIRQRSLIKRGFNQTPRGAERAVANVLAERCALKSVRAIHCAPLVPLSRVVCLLAD